MVFIATHDSCNSQPVPIPFGTLLDSTEEDTPPCISSKSNLLRANFLSYCYSQSLHRWLHHQLRALSS